MTPRRRNNLDEEIADLEDGPWFRRVEVAGLLGVTPSAILAISSESGNYPEFVPTTMIEWAGKLVYLYTQEQLDGMREHFKRANAGAGRPRIWSLDESADRRRRYDLARYYARRADELREVERTEEAGAYDLRAQEMRTELDDELAERQASRVTD